MSLISGELSLGDGVSPGQPTTRSVSVSLAGLVGGRLLEPGEPCRSCRWRVPRRNWASAAATRQRSATTSHLGASATSGRGRAAASDTCYRQDIDHWQLAIHADRGTSMASKPVALLLPDLGVTTSHSRPHVSNDNPY